MGMQRRQFLTGAVTLVGMPGAALAQTAEDQVISQLKRQGYRSIEVYRTLLGRTRILATGRRGRREIILNPSTGAILRDYEDRSFHNDEDGDSSGRGGGRKDDDRDDDVDEKDDEDRSDNSGKGNSDDDDDDNDDDDGEGNDD